MSPWAPRAVITASENFRLLGPKPARRSPTQKRPMPSKNIQDGWRQVFRRRPSSGEITPARATTGVDSSLFEQSPANRTFRCRAPQHREAPVGPWWSLLSALFSCRPATPPAYKNLTMDAPRFSCGMRPEKPQSGQATIAQPLAGRASQPKLESNAPRSIPAYRGSSEWADNSQAPTPRCGRTSTSPVNMAVAGLPPPKMSAPGPSANTSKTRSERLMILEQFCSASRIGGRYLRRSFTQDGKRAESGGAS